MPSAFPGFAAAIPVLLVSAPVWPVREDCWLAPRYCSFLSSWANAATQTCNVNVAMTENLVSLSRCFISVAPPGFKSRSPLDLCEQTIFVGLSPQDMGSAVYQCGHAVLGGGIAPTPATTALVGVRNVFARPPDYPHMGHLQK